MDDQQENKQPTSSESEEASNKLTSCFQFCGHELKITRDFNLKFGIPAIIWEPGRVLCHYFEKEQISFSGKKVIELGSGTGMVGILAILLGGDVTLTDLPYVLGQIEYNVTSNIPSDIIHRSKVSALLWGTDLDRFPTDFDVILGSDIVYKSREFQLLIMTLQHLSNENTVIYFSTKMRVSMGAVDFHDKLIPQHFNSEIVHRIALKDINVFKITKRCTDV
ncbi:EEF1A lysine methyltransferase 3-like [Heterodontus francisci]|uniref:EEF1A lysine methyltransferase 3-like n=1 Tax=Heterodontus francisci TaxID=7792 RepID=UPI00355C8CC9